MNASLRAKDVFVGYEYDVFTVLAVTRYFPIVRVDVHQSGWGKRRGWFLWWTRAFEETQEEP